MAGYSKRADQIETLLKDLVKDQHEPTEEEGYKAAVAVAALTGDPGNFDMLEFWLRTFADVSAMCLERPADGADVAEYLAECMAITLDDCYSADTHRGI